jgi:hypothetical protein
LSPQRIFRKRFDIEVHVPMMSCAIAIMNLRGGGL